MVESPRDIERERARADAAEARVSELEVRLLEAEQRLARVGDLELELRDVTTRYDLALQQALQERDEARAQLERAAGVHADMVGSASWRLTKPLRLAAGRRRRS